MTLEIDNWYGGARRGVEVCTETAIWYHTGLPPVEIRWVLVRDRLGKFEPQALLSTNIAHTPQEMLTWFVRRWAMEVSFEEARAHLGIETQRQWNELAIARTTPALFELYSLVSLMTEVLNTGEKKVARSEAWYVKVQPTFSDAIALVRRHLWGHSYFSMSEEKADVIKIPRSLFERLSDAVCYAA